MKFYPMFLLSFLSVLSYPCCVSATDFNIKNINRPNAKRIIDNLDSDNVIPLPLNPQSEEPSYCKQMREDFSKRWGELHEKMDQFRFCVFFYFGLFNGYKKTSTESRHRKRTSGMVSCSSKLFWRSLRYYR